MPGAVIALPKKISIDKADKLKQKLEKLKVKYSSLVVDFKKVKEIDIAGIQLLSVFALDCVHDEIEFGCLGPLDADIKRDLQLSGILVSRNEGDYIFPFVYKDGVKIELS